jgi:tetratricopeptide (TPR) repeat protein
MVMASVDTNAINKIEKPIDIVDVQSSDELAVIKDNADNIALTQNKTAEDPNLNSATVPDNVVQNVTQNDTSNDSKKEDTDTAIAEISRQIELNNSDAELYVLRGNLHMDKQDYEKAVNDYTKAIKINPDDVAAYNNRGQVYASIGETKQAIKDYKKAIKIGPENINAYINRGNAYYSRQSYRKAISDYTRAIKIDPEISLAYINRGITYFREKSFSNAINDFSKALELDNRDAGTYLLRSNAYYSKGEYMQTINDCSKALEINPDFIDAYNNRGMAYEGMGDFDKAILDYSKAIEIASKDPDAYFNRKLISTQKTRTNRAGMAIPIWSIRKGGLYPYDDYKDRYPKIAYEYSSLWEYSDPFMNRRRLYIKTGQLDKAANNFKTIENSMMSNKLENEKDKHMAKQLKPDYSLLEAEAKKEFEALMRTKIQSKTQFDSTFEVIEENRRRLGY